MDAIYKKIEQIQTNKRSIPKKDLSTMIKSLTSEIRDHRTIEKLILNFFSLNSKDVEAVLKGIWLVVLDEFSENEKRSFDHGVLEKLDKLVSNLNQVSVKQTNLPFHLSAALGKLNVDDTFIESTDSSLKEMFLENSDKSLKSECPFGEYPRYVPYMFPWKLRLSFSSRTKQRNEDSGCHIEHGPFDGKIRAWWSWNPTIILMVYLQGWGGNLAANDNHFFYKWWFVAAVGLTPYHCQWMLHARKY